FFSVCVLYFVEHHVQIALPQIRDIGLLSDERILTALRETREKRLKDCDDSAVALYRDRIISGLEKEIADPGCLTREIEKKRLTTVMKSYRAQEREKDEVILARIEKRMELVQKEDEGEEDRLM
ncbi:hypothetical protein PFISCL1PPCAC_3426, partial [Pristionchus fissidentatus]